MNQVEGKHVLLMVPEYYGYEKYLLDGLKHLGARVTFIENKAFQYDPLNKGTGWYEQLFCKKKDYLQKAILPSINQHFDLCLVVDLFSFNPLITQTLRKHNPDLHCILYLWDNVRGYKWTQFFSCFDQVLSFDPVEAESLNITYFPNFYPQTTVSKNIVYDLCFVGSLQVHRLELLTRLNFILKRENKSAFFYLYLPQNYNHRKYNAFVYFLVKLFPGKFTGYRKLYTLLNKKLDHEFVFHEPLDLSVAIQKISQSRCIIDLPFPTQTGSTQRVIQAIALGKKVITTNTSVSKDAFYDPRWIKIVSLPNITIDWDWLNKEEKIPDIDHLRLDNWLVRLLNLKRQ